MCYRVVIYVILSQLLCIQYTNAVTQAEAKRNFENSQKLQQQKQDFLDRQQKNNVSIDTQKYVKKNKSDKIEPSNTCFNINNIELIGDFSEKFQFSLTKHLSGKDNVLGTCMGVNEINKTVTQIQNDIINQGYVTTRVLIGDQNIASGNLVLTLIPGRIDKFIWNNKKNKALPVKIKNALPMKSGDILNVREIEQTLENLRQTPNNDVSFDIAPSENKADSGYSDLLITSNEKMTLSAYASLDDTGQKDTGIYQANTTVSVGNLLSIGELTTLSLGHNLDGTLDGKDNDNTSYSASISLPYKNLQVKLAHNGYLYNQTVVGAFQQYVYRGVSNGTNVTVKYLLYRDNKNKVYVQTGGYLKNQKNYINDTEVKVQRRRTSGVNTGLSYQYFSKRANLSANINHSKGTKAFGAIEAPEKAFNEGDAKADKVKLGLDITLPFRVFNHSVQSSTNIKAAYAKETLIPADRFSIGSRYTVRGFESKRSLSGDRGIYIQQGLTTPIYKSHQLTLGLDWGYAEMVDKQKNKDMLGHHLIGSSLGLKGRVMNLPIQYDVYVGYPLGQPKKFSKKEATAGFSIHWQQNF